MCFLFCSNLKNSFILDRGDVFGWGNNEYDQLSMVTKDQSQVAIPQNLAFKDVGKIVKVAAAGATCAVLNG